MSKRNETSPVQDLDSRIRTAYRILDQIRDGLSGLQDQIDIIEEAADETGEELAMTSAALDEAESHLTRAAEQSIKTNRLLHSLAVAEDDNHWHLGRVGHLGCTIRAYDHERRDGVAPAYFVGIRVSPSAAPRELVDRCGTEDYIYVECMLDRTFTEAGGRLGQIVAVPRAERQMADFDYRVSYRA